MPNRWTATAYYRTDAGMIDVVWTFDELHELDRYIERGPSWYALDRIEVRLSAMSKQTIEQTLAE